MSNPYSPAEHERQRRRRMRQLLGAVLCVLIIIGIVNVIGGAVNGVASLFDDTEEKLEYEYRLQPLVNMDPLPFADLSQVDIKQLREYSIWAAVAAAQTSEGGLESYQRDPDTDGVLLPAVEVDAALVSLLGPNYNDLLATPIINGSFETDIVYPYLEEEKAYIVPVTSQMGMYYGHVDNLHKKDGKLYVTVGYVPSAAMLGDYSPTASNEPTKYMDYVFEKVDKEYYLRGLQGSEKKVSSSAPVVDPNADVDVDVDFDAMSAIAGEAAMEDESEVTGQADSAAAESTAESSAESSAEE